MKRHDVLPHWQAGDIVIIETQNFPTVLVVISIVALITLIVRVEDDDQVRSWAMM